MENNNVGNMGKVAVNKLDFEASLKKMGIAVHDEVGKSRSFRDVLDDVAKSYDSANEEERQSIVSLFSGSPMG